MAFIVISLQFHLKLDDIKRHIKIFLDKVYYPLGDLIYYITS